MFAFKHYINFPRWLPTSFSSHNHYLVGGLYHISHYHFHISLYKTNQTIHPLSLSPHPQRKYLFSFFLSFEQTSKIPTGIYFKCSRVCAFVENFSTNPKILSICSCQVFSLYFSSPPFGCWNFWRKIPGKKTNIKKEMIKSIKKIKFRVNKVILYLSLNFFYLFSFYIKNK